MMTTEITTAAIITDTSSTMPTAVITESSEKTMSRSMIWTITLRERRRDPRRSVPFLAFQLARGSRTVLLASRNRPPTMQDQVAPGDLVPEQR